MKRKIVRATLAIMLILALVLAIGFAWGYRQVSLSLPQLDGTISVKGLGDKVQLHRDQLGVVTVEGESRSDVAFGLGFAHGQDRFFQMDLLRRNSAGELAELVGAAVVSRDKTTRVHRFRHLAQQRLKIERPEVVEILQRYSEGVNAGLKSLGNKPFEYLMLGLEPQPWKPEDSLLVVFSMYLDLQNDQPRREIDRGLLHDTVPKELYEFLMARGDSWDSPIHGGAFEVPAIPGPEVFNARDLKIASNRSESSSIEFAEPFIPGSNNWAVSGKFTQDGRALVADDMHLQIQVPHVWYRARWLWKDSAEPSKKREMTGVSLPGAPVMIVGSNSHIAWGYTNTECDWTDLVVVEVDAEDLSSYRTADGPKKFEKHLETISVKGAADVSLEVVSTIWGPIVAKDHKGRLLASRWVAHDVDGVNVNLIELENVTTVNQAIEIANNCGIPHQNFVVGDADGHIAWTIAGRVPRRFGHDGRLPQSWSDGSKGWNGYLEPAEYPRIVDPENGRLWSANARMVSGDFYAILGDCGYDCGARQGQIRDRLLALEKASEADMLSIQLDDRALFMDRWKELLLSVLTDEAVKGNPGREQLKSIVSNWEGRADVTSVSYRVVVSFRNSVIRSLCDLVSESCKKADGEFSLLRNRRIEGPLWRILEEKPLNFLSPKFETWQDFLLSKADAVIKQATANGQKLEEFTWGRLNTTRIKHPLSLAVPSLSRWLDMPEQQLSGGWSDMPKIQAPNFGASQRMAVSPGREKDGYMHIPCGQSGHPLSPFYASSHQDWAEGKATPFLPGQSVHTIVLTPKD